MTEPTSQPVDPNWIKPVEPKPAKRRRWPWITGIVGAGIVGIIIGASSAEPETITETTTVDASAEQQAELDKRAAELDDWQNDLTEQEVALDEREQELDAREQAIGAAEAQVAANTVSDGIWTVGVDIEPGTYRATDVPGDCYWAILATGSNGADIIDNGLPGGGNPSVTLSEGQDFETLDCGDWHLQQ